MKKIVIGALGLLFMPCLYGQSINMVANDTITQKVCGERIFDNGGEFGDYKEYSKSAITLIPSESGKILKLTLEKISVHAGCGLHIYKGAKIDSTKEIGYYTRSLNGKLGLVYGDTITLFLTGGYGSRGGIAIKTECVSTLPDYDYIIEPLVPTPLVAGVGIVSYRLSTLPVGVTGMSDLYVQYYLSKDTLFSKNDILLTGAQMSGLGIYSTSINEQITFPELTGKYYLLIVIDPRKLVKETNEKNNVVVFPTTLN